MRPRAGIAALALLAILAGFPSASNCVAESRSPGHPPPLTPAAQKTSPGVPKAAGGAAPVVSLKTVSYTHLRAHETEADL
eukprot:3237837-Rhodomonas_salina.1